MKKRQKRLIALYWDNGEEKEYYMTDAPGNAIEVAIEHLQREIEDYCTDDFVEFLQEDYYIEHVKAEEYNF